MPDLAIGKKIVYYGFKHTINFPTQQGVTMCPVGETGPGLKILIQGDVTTYEYPIEPDGKTVQQIILQKREGNDEIQKAHGKQGLTGIVPDEQGKVNNSTSPVVINPEAEILVSICP